MGSAQRGLYSCTAHFSVCLSPCYIKRCSNGRLYINLIANGPFLCLFTSIIYKTFPQWKTVDKPHCELPHFSVCLPPLYIKRFSNGRLNINLIVNCPFLCLFNSIICKTFLQWKTEYKPRCALPISLFVYLHVI